MTGVIGNWLIQHWQSRNWLAQQRFNGNEKEYTALKELTDEIAILLGERIYHMQRLTLSFNNVEPEKFSVRLAEYDDVVKRWNVRLTSFYFRLPLLTTTQFSFRLERDVQQKLVSIGNSINRLIDEKQKGMTINHHVINKVTQDLNGVQGTAINFNNDIFTIVLERKKELYEGKSIRFSIENINNFSSWFLFKAIFARDVDSLTIVRSTLDS